MWERIPAGWRWLARSSFWVNLDQVIRSLGDLAIVALLARIASQNVLGEYKLMLSILMAASLVVLSGFNGSLMRALVRGQDGTLREVTRLSWWWSRFGMLVLFLFGAGWFRWKSETIGLGIMVAALAFPFFHMWRRWEVVLSAKAYFKLRALYGLLMTVLVTVSVAVVSLLWPERVVVIFLVHMVVATALHAVLYRRAQRYLQSTAVETGWRKSGYTLVLSEIANTGYNHLDRILLAFWFGPGELAIYVVATVFGEGVKRVMGNVVQAYVPRLHRGNTQWLLRWFWERRWRLGIGGGVVMVGLWMVTPGLVTLAFSDSYVASAGLAQWYLLIVPGHLLSSLLGYLLIKERRERVSMTAFISAGLVNIGLYVVLIPMWGLSGAVLGSVGYYVALALFMAWGMRDILGRAVGRERGVEERPA